MSNSATLWTVAHQGPQLMGFSRQEYWRGFPCPPSEDLANPGIKPRSPALAGEFFSTSATWEVHMYYVCMYTFCVVHMCLYKGTHLLTV